MSHAAELFSWVPLPYCSPPGCPFPVKSLALSADVSPQTIHFRVLDKSPVSGPRRGPLSCNSGRWGRVKEAEAALAGGFPPTQALGASSLQPKRQVTSMWGMIIPPPRRASPLCPPGKHLPLDCPPDPARPSAPRPFPSHPSFSPTNSFPVP